MITLQIGKRRGEERATKGLSEAHAVFADSSNLSGYFGRKSVKNPNLGDFSTHTLLIFNSIKGRKFPSRIQYRSHGSSSHGATTLSYMGLLPPERSSSRSTIASLDTLPTSMPSIRVYLDIRDSVKILGPSTLRFIKTAFSNVRQPSSFA